MTYKVFNYQSEFKLESGYTLPCYHLVYSTHGRLNAAKDNVVWVFHALTANSDPLDWWDGLVGEGKLFDPAVYFIVCVNMPGSCYGSIGPLDVNAATGEPYCHSFPFFTIKDMVMAYQPLREFLAIKKIHIGIGGSMGGQQLLEWAVEEPHLFENIFPIATNATHSAWGIAFNASQRMTIEADSTWKEKNETAGLSGMKAARSIAMLSYRNYNTYHAAQAEENNSKTENYRSESYQRYQGEKLAKRFNAFSYFFLSKSMDAHDLGRQRGGILQALKQIKAATLVIGIESDILFPVEEQQFLAKHIPNATYQSICSTYGHDGFLLEYAQIQKCIQNFLAIKKIVGKALSIENEKTI